MSAFEDVLNDLQDAHGADPGWTRLQAAHREELAAVEATWLREVNRLEREHDHLRRVVRAMGAMADVAVAEEGDDS